MSEAPTTDCPDNTRLRDFLAGRMTVEDMDGLVLHFDGCQSCQQRLAELDDSEASVDSWVGHNGEIPYANETKCAEAVGNISRSKPTPSKAPVLPTKPPEHLGEYELLEPLGEGGMGAVFRARHTSLESICAIKMLLPNRQADRATIERFEREMVALGKLDHPNIVRAIDAGEDQGIHYLAMEFVRGIDRSRVLRLRKQLPIAEACEVARQAALGLGYVHTHGRVHRDVKPSNLMLRSDGVVKLLDLGLAHVEEFEIDESSGSSDELITAANLDLTRSHQIMGTIEYMAPEQASDTRSVDYRADIYSLGCTLYKLLAGQSPFISTGEVSQLSQVLAHVQTPAPPIREFRDDVPDALAKVIEHMLAKAPEERPESAEKVAAALEPFCRGADLVDMLRTPETARTAARIPMATAVRPADASITAAKPFPWMTAIAGVAVVLMIMVGIGVYNLSGGFGAAEGKVQVSVAADTNPALLGQSNIKLISTGSGKSSDVSATGPIYLAPGTYKVEVPDDSGFHASPGKLEVHPNRVSKLLISHSGTSVFTPPAPRDPSIVKTAGEPVDLLPLLDPARDFEADDWLLTGNTLIAKQSNASSVQFPIRPPERYRLEMTVERTAGNESLCIGLPTGGEPVPVIIDGWPSNGFYSGIYQVNGRSILRQDRSIVARGMQLPIGQPRTLVATLSSARGQTTVSLELDSQTVFLWRGDDSQLGQCRWMPPNDPSVFMFGRFNGAAFRFSNVRVVPLSGEAEVIEFADRETDPQLAAAQWAVWNGGQYWLAIPPEANAEQTIIVPGGVRRVSQIPANVRVEGINLSGSQWIDDHDLSYFAGLDTLTTLELDRTSITAAGIEQLGSLPNLRELSVATSAFSDQQAGVDALSVLKSPELKTVSFASTDSGTAVMEAISKLTKLTTLNLSDTRITGEDLALLADLTELRSLNLDRTLLTDDALSQLPPLPKLELLLFNDTENANLDSLTSERFPQLAQIELRHVEVSVEQVAALAERFPNATIDLGFEPFDVASIVDPTRDGYRGTWTVDDGKLSVRNGNPARLAVPMILPDEFDLKAKLRRNSGVNAPVFGMPLPDGTQVLLGFDHWPDYGGYTILHGIDGKMERNSEQLKQMRTFTAERPVASLEIRIRRSGPMISIEADVEGETVIDWEGEASRLDPDDWWFSDDGQRLTISEYSGNFTFESLTVTPVSGRIKVLDPAVPMYRNDPDREVAQWALAHGGRLFLRAGWGAGYSTWADNLSELPSRPFRIRQIRRLNDQQLPSEWLAAVGELQQLEHLELNQTTFDNADLVHLEKVKSLKLVNCLESSLNDVGLESLAKLPLLTEINLSNTSVTGEGMVALENHARLEVLRAVRTTAGNATATVAGTLPKLEHLTLAESNITGAGLEALAGHENLLRIYLQNCSQLVADDLGKLAAIPKLQVVAIENNQLDPVACQRLATISSMQRLRLYGNPVGDAGIEYLALRKNLLELSVGATGVTDRSMPTIGGFTELRHLGLTNNPGITDAAIPHLAKLTKLNELHVTGTSISAAGVRRLKQALPSCMVASSFDQPKFRKIDLVNSGVTDETLAGVLGNLDDVTELKLGGVQVTDKSLTLIASIPNLKRIYFERAAVTNDGIAALAGSSSIERVEFWYMPQITGEVTEHLARIANLNAVIFKTTNVFGPGLERLHDKGIQSVHIGHGKLDGAILKEYVVPFGQLESLDLAGAAISDVDVSQLVPLGLANSLHLGYNGRIKGPGLASIADMPGLETLMLDGAGVDDQGLTHLKTATQLDRLFLRKTTVTDASVDTIAALEKLTYVDLTDTQFTAKGVAELAKRLPQASIRAEHLGRPKNSEKLTTQGWKPSFAPDGNRLAYGLAAGTGMRIIDRTSGEKQLIDIRGKDPAWSPRGDLIAFVHEPFHHSGKAEVWVVKPDGSEARSISDLALYPFWTQGGAKLVYYSIKSSGLVSVEIDSETLDPQPYAPKMPSYYADATDDDKFYAYASKGTLKVIDRASGESSFEHSFGGEQEGTGLVAFSPDGRYLAYAPFVGMHQGIWLFDWRTGAHVKWIEGEYGAPAWSPDGKQLAFDYRRNHRADQMELWVGTLDEVLPLAEPQ